MKKVDKEKRYVVCGECGVLWNIAINQDTQHGYLCPKCRQKRRKRKFMGKLKWQVCTNMGVYEVWRQTRPLRYGEPMHNGVRESAGIFDTEMEAQAKADQLNKEREAYENGNV